MAERFGSTRPIRASATGRHVLPRCSALKDSRALWNSCKVHEDWPHRIANAGLPFGDAPQGVAFVGEESVCVTWALARNKEDTMTLYIIRGDTVMAYASPQ